MIIIDFCDSYVEPARPEPKPQPTMASRLGIDVNDTTPGSSRPSSSLGGSGATAGRFQTSRKVFFSQHVIVSKGGTDWEAFKGRGETLNGRKTRGKGISARKVEDTPSDPRIIRTEFVFLRCYFSLLILTSFTTVLADWLQETTSRLRGKSQQPSTFPQGNYSLAMLTFPIPHHLPKNPLKHLHPHSLDLEIHSQAAEQLQQMHHRLRRKRKRKQRRSQYRKSGEAVKHWELDQQRHRRRKSLSRRRRGVRRQIGVLMMMMLL